MENKRQLIIYNSNNPDLFCVLHSNENKNGDQVLNLDQMGIIETTCLGGPYLAFYRNEPEIILSICRRGHPLEVTGDNVWWDLRTTRVFYDEKQQLLVSRLLRQICQMELTAKARKKDKKRKPARKLDEREGNK